MYIEPLDKEAYSFLEFLYTKKECTIVDVQRYLGIHNLKDNIRIVGILLPLFESGYLSILNPNLNILDSISFKAYIDACQNNSVALISVSYTHLRAHET